MVKHVFLFYLEMLCNIQINLVFDVYKTVNGKKILFKLW